MRIFIGVLTWLLFGVLLAILVVLEDNYKIPVSRHILAFIFGWNSRKIINYILKQINYE